MDQYYIKKPYSHSKAYSIDNNTNIIYLSAPDGSNRLNLRKQPSERENYSTIINAFLEPISPPSSPKPQRIPSSNNNELLVLSNAQPTSSVTSDTIGSTSCIIDLTEDDTNDKSNRSSYYPAESGSYLNIIKAFIEPISPASSPTPQAMNSSTQITPPTVAACTQPPQMPVLLKFGEFSATIQLKLSILDDARMPIFPTLPKVFMHPAPLPRLNAGGEILSKYLPAPEVFIGQLCDSFDRKNVYTLNWNFKNQNKFTSVKMYQLYAYHEVPTQVPHTKLWTIVGNLKAVSLPMFCILKEFVPGDIYHFSVRAVDEKLHFGPFSKPTKKCLV